MTDLSDVAYFAITLFGWFGISVALISIKKASLRGIANLLWTGFGRTKPERQITTPYVNMSDKQMERIISKVISVLAVLAGVYGILFALIISEKASLVFVTWSFLIWCGWVLAILLRICHCCAILLTDYYQWDRTKREITLHGIAKFAKHSGYLLIPTTSFVPIFATLKTTTLDQIVQTYPWELETSLFLGIFTVALVTIAVYAFVLAIRNLVNLEYGDIYQLVVISLWFMGLFGISNSPLEPVTSKVIGLWLFDSTLPSALAAPEMFLILIGTGLGTWMLMSVLWKFLTKVAKVLRKTK